MKFLSALAIAALSFIGANAMTSNEIVKDMKVGWSLGNTLDSQCIEWLDYSADQTASETCWGNIKTSSGIFQKMNQLGFNTFRIPTTWDGHFIDEQYTIAPEWMGRVHEIVDYAHKTGSYVILNIHHERWNYAFGENLEKAKGILVKVWTQIAEEFKDYDEHLIFEGLNEPRKVGSTVEWNGGDKEGWDFVNEMNALFVKTVRSTGGMNADRHLMVPTYGASSTENAINGFKLPNDDKLIVSLHAYTPYNFALNNGDGAVTTFDENNVGELDYLMELIQKKFRSQNIPVVIGEFGAMNRDNEAQRKKWANYYITKAHAMNVPCVWWDNGVFEGEGERFGLLDRETLSVAYPDIIEGLMSGLGESTTPSVPSTQEPSIPSVPSPETTTTVSSTPSVPTAEPSIPSSSSTDDDYYSCDKYDWACKSEMSKKCNAEVAACWRQTYNSEVAAKCKALSQKCGKIWSN